MAKFGLEAKSFLAPARRVRDHVDQDNRSNMTKSELIDSLVQNHTQLGYRDVELAVKTMLEHMAQTLSTGDRIEIRGFGSFSLHYRPPRVGRNPKSGDPVSLPEKFVPHFKPGKQLRERVNDGIGS